MPFSFNNFQTIFIIVGALVLAGFVFTIMSIFSPKIRSRFMSKQIKATRIMMEDNKDDLEYMARENANISKEGVKITTRAIKDGLKDTKYCKYCGNEIDEDSIYCKKCGKKQ